MILSHDSFEYYKRGSALVAKADNPVGSGS